MKSLRGTLSSLVKKGVIEIDNPVINFEEHLWVEIKSNFQIKDGNDETGYSLTNIIRK